MAITSWLDTKLHGQPETIITAALIAAGSLLILAAFLFPAWAKMAILIWVVAP